MTIPETTISLGPRPPAPTPTMSSGETLEAFGTMAAGVDFMLETIKLGSPRLVSEEGKELRVEWKRGPMLNASLWLHFVPDRYQRAAVNACGEAAAELRGLRLDDNGIKEYVVALHRAFVDELHRMKWWGWFWRVWRPIGELAAQKGTR